MLALLHQPEHVDEAPASVYAKVLDEGRYLASVSSMYRILRGAGEVRERRRVASHPAQVRPELVADGPNAVWSWDITKLAGPAKWSSFYLYVIIDIYSRYVPGWMIAARESALLAERLLAETIAKQRVAREALTIHADRGASMASKPVALLLADLGVTKSHSRPHCSNDNPYSEAHFKTLKYRPDFPARFGSIEDARAFCERFFGWYNEAHRHSGIGFHTPADVHHGRAGPGACASAGPSCSRRPTERTPSALSGSPRSRRRCRRRRGSTARATPPGKPRSKEKRPKNRHLQEESRPPRQRTPTHAIGSCPRLTESHEKLSRKG